MSFPLVTGFQCLWNSNASALSNIDVWLTIEGYIWEKKLDVNKFYEFSYEKYTLNRHKLIIY